MSTLSICVIAKNEERFLEPSLKSIASIADEIVFVDTGSNDSTIEIAKKFTDNIHHYKWADDFSVAYNYSTDKASNDYIFRWDADFYCPPETLNLIKKLKANDFYSHNIIAGRWANIDTNTGLLTGFVLRDLIYQKGQYRSFSPIHAYIKPEAGVSTKRLVREDLMIEHHKDSEAKGYRYDQSYKMITRALRQDPNSTHLRFHLILALVYMEKLEEANMEIDRFLSQWPGYIDSRVCMLLEKKLACLIGIGRADKASLIIKKYKSRFTGNIQFLLLEADVASLTNTKLATAKYQEFIRLNTGPGSIDGPYILSRYETHPRAMLKKLMDV